VMGYPPQGAGVGVRKLSELIIDVDKDWRGYRIINVGAPIDDTCVPRARAGDILSGVFSVERIPDLPRSKISDLFTAPFWGNIPDKPLTFPPSPHGHDASEITTGVLSLDRVPVIPSGKIADGAIITAKVADGAITTAKLADLSVTAAKLADGSVTTAKIADSAITTAKIADLAVTRAKLEYPTVDVPVLYLFAIGKAFLDLMDGNRFTFVVTTNSFTDKQIAGGQLMKAAESGYYEGFFARCQADPRANAYLTRIDTGATTADVILDKVVAGTVTSLGAQAVDLNDDTCYVFGISTSGSSIKSVRYSRWSVSAGSMSFGTATTAVSATDTAFASGTFAVRASNLGGPGETAAGLHAFLRAPASPGPSALAIVEVEVAGDGSNENPFRPLLSENLVDVSELQVPDFLKIEKRKYDILRAKGFTEEEMKVIFGYVPQHQVDLDSVSWGAFEFSDRSPTNIVVITSDNPYGPGAIDRQMKFVEEKGLRTLRPPRDYDEAVSQYNELKRDFKHWLAGKDNYAYQTLGLEIFDLFQNVDFYYGELVEHKTHYDQLKAVPEQELARRLEELEEKLRRVEVLREERDRHLSKLREVVRRGW